MKRHIVGIDVGGTHIQLALFNEQQIVAEKQFLTDKEIGAG